MILVDSNIIIDILTDDKNWAEWSLDTLNSQKTALVINPIIYGEISIKIDSIELLDEALASFKRLDIPYAAAFLAGKAFLSYRKKEGNKVSPLPDFFIGAHASILNIPLITRDIRRYKTYFPKIKLIHPANI